MNIKDLVEAFEDCGYSVCSYSGRGMYGKECLGVTFEHGSAVDLVCEVIQNIADRGGRAGDSLQNVYSACAMLSNASEDSMGLGTIVYWPSLSWAKYQAELAEESSDNEMDDDEPSEIPKT